MAKRDMTERQFLAAMEKHGFGEIGPFGYVHLPIDGQHIRVSIRNARSDRLRDILAYLLHEKARHERKPTP